MIGWWILIILLILMFLVIAKLLNLIISSLEGLAVGQDCLNRQLKEIIEIEEIQAGHLSDMSTCLSAQEDLLVNIDSTLNKE